MTQSIDIALHEGPLPPAARWLVAGAGAVVRFEGVVRPTEHGRALAALHYEAYEPMTTQQLHRLAQSIVAEHGLLGVRVAHSVGDVAVGAVSFRLDVAGAHRAEALSAMAGFIDRLKQQVPLWKVPRFADERAGLEART